MIKDFGEKYKEYKEKLNGDFSHICFEKNRFGTSYNTAYTLRAIALALRDIAFGSIVYAGNDRQHWSESNKIVEGAICLKM